MTNEEVIDPITVEDLEEEEFKFPEEEFEASIETPFNLSDYGLVADATALGTIIAWRFVKIEDLTDAAELVRDKILKRNQ